MQSSTAVHVPMPPFEAKRVHRASSVASMHQVGTTRETGKGQ
jgi:hypothetical protein